MEIAFDPTKNMANIAKHGLSFDDFDDLDTVAVVTIDERYDYGETRYRAFGR